MKPWAITLKSKKFEILCALHHFQHLRSYCDGALLVAGNNDFFIVLPHWIDKHNHKT